MSNLDIISALLALGLAVWLSVAAVRLALRSWRRFWGRFGAVRFDFQSVVDIPLSDDKRKKFCALALAKGISQKRLLADCIDYYFEQKVK